MAKWKLMVRTQSLPLLLGHVYINFLHFYSFFQKFFVLHCRTCKKAVHYLPPFLNKSYSVFPHVSHVFDPQTFWDDFWCDKKGLLKIIKKHWETDYMCFLPLILKNITLLRHPIYRIISSWTDKFSYNSTENAGFNYGLRLEFEKIIVVNSYFFFNFLKK